MHLGNRDFTGLREPGDLTRLAKRDLLPWRGGGGGGRGKVAEGTRGGKGRVHSQPLLCPSDHAGLSQHLLQRGERSSPFHSWRTHLQRQPSVDRGKFQSENAAVSQPPGFEASPC